MAPKTKPDEFHNKEVDRRHFLKRVLIGVVAPMGAAIVAPMGVAVVAPKLFMGRQTEPQAAAQDSVTRRCVTDIRQGRYLVAGKSWCSSCHRRNSLE